MSVPTAANGLWDCCAVPRRVPCPFCPSFSAFFYRKPFCPWRCRSHKGPFANGPGRGPVGIRRKGEETFSFFFVPRAESEVLDFICFFFLLGQVAHFILALPS